MRVVPLVPSLTEAVAALQGDGPSSSSPGFRTLEQALAEPERVLTTGCGPARPRRLDEAEAAWAALPAPDGPPRPAIVPIWRRPWMMLRGRSSPRPGRSARSR